MPPRTFFATRDDAENDSGGFVWTAQMNKTSTWITVGMSISSLITGIVVLVLAFLVYCKPATRGTLRRQSFRLLLTVQITGVIWSISSIVESLLTAPSRWCQVSVVLGIFTNNFVNFLIALIAINLQLVLCFDIRTSGFTRWYISGSFLLAAVISIPGIARGVWGWDPLLDYCWIALEKPSARVAWEIGSFYAWNFASSLIALVSTAAVLYRLFSHYNHTRNMFAKTTGTSDASQNDIVRRVALRIVWYPLILIVCQTIAMVADMSVDISESLMNSYAGYVLWCTYGFFYGCMPFFYALVALFVDPSFAIAIRSLFGATETSRTSSGDPKTRPMEIMLSQVRTTIADTGEQLPERPEHSNASKVSLDDDSALETPKQPVKGVSQLDFAVPEVSPQEAMGARLHQARRLTLKNVFRKKVNGLDLNEL